MLERDTSRTAARLMRRARQLRAYRDYFRFRLDTTALPVSRFVRYEYPSRERGIRALLRLPPKPTGPQELWVDRRAEGGGYEPYAVVPVVVE